MPVTQKVCKICSKVDTIDKFQKNRLVCLICYNKEQVQRNNIAKEKEAIKRAQLKKQQEEEHQKIAEIVNDLGAIKNVMKSEKIDKLIDTSIVQSEQIEELINVNKKLVNLLNKRYNNDSVL